MARKPAAPVTVAAATADAAVLSRLSPPAADVSSTPWPSAPIQIGRRAVAALGRGSLSDAVQRLTGLYRVAQPDSDRRILLAMRIAALRRLTVAEPAAALPAPPPAPPVSAPEPAPPAAPVSKGHVTMINLDDLASMLAGGQEEEEEPVLAQPGSAVAAGVAPDFSWPEDEVPAVPDAMAPAPAPGPRARKTATVTKPAPIKVDFSGFDEDDPPRDAGPDVLPEPAFVALDFAVPVDSDADDAPAPQPAAQAKKRARPARSAPVPAPASITLDFSGFADLTGDEEAQGQNDGKAD